LQYAARWAAERGMQLDAALSMRDEGLSAYHQQHIKSGALGLFLAAVGEGRIVPGSVLIVEGLDRLSRAEPIQAQAQLAQIINAGITVVTASDGKEYTREGLKATPMDLVYSLLVMIRAHEESDTKSKRVTAAIIRQCEQWIAGAWRGVIRNGKDPAWLRWDGTAWIVDEARAEAVRAALDLFRAGHGAGRIVQRLAAAGLSTTGRTMTASHIYKLVRARWLRGEKEIEVGGETYRLPGYYPALLTPAEWDELQLLADDRGRRRVKGTLPHIITGIGIARCGYCGQAMVGQNLETKPRLPDGRIRDSYRRLLCCGKAIGQPCTVSGSCSVAPIEHALLTYCSDQMRLDALRGDADRSAAPRAQIAQTRQRIADLQRQLERITTALASDDDAPPLAFLRRARDLEREIAAEQVQLETAERELAGATGQALTHDQAQRWAALREAVAAQDYDARVQVRQMIAQTFAAIIVYHAGRDAQHRGPIDLVLQAKGGAPRWLRIDRITGEMLTGIDLHRQADVQPSAAGAGSAPVGATGLTAADLADAPGAASARAAESSSSPTTARPPVTPA
jgi:DNA invertase Pin-like site-specific DNA recombinase